MGSGDGEGNVSGRYLGFRSGATLSTVEDSGTLGCLGVRMGYDKNWVKRIIGGIAASVLLPGSLSCCKFNVSHSLSITVRQG